MPDGYRGALEAAQHRILALEEENAELRAELEAESTPSDRLQKVNKRLKRQLAGAHKRVSDARSSVRKRIARAAANRTQDERKRILFLERYVAELEDRNDQLSAELEETPPSREDAAPERSRSALRPARPKLTRVALSEQGVWGSLRDFWYSRPDDRDETDV